MQSCGPPGIEFETSALISFSHGVTMLLLDMILFQD